MRGAFYSAEIGQGIIGVGSPELCVYHLLTTPCQASAGPGPGGMVMQDLEQSIRERAYHLWIESGCWDGNAEAHWLAAQREVLSASLGTFARAPEDRQPDTPKKFAKSRKTKSSAT